MKNEGDYGSSTSAAEHTSGTERITRGEAEASSGTDTDVVEVVTSAGGYRLHGNAQAVLDEIRPPSESSRFLQSWDAKRRVLTFGLGDGNKGLTVSSNRDVK